MRPESHDEVPFDLGHSDTLPRSRCAASPSTSGQRRVRRGESEPELYKVFVPTGLGRCGV